MEKGLESSRKEIEQLKTWIAESDQIVFFGGAGVSTESNIPDFRSEDGLYRQEYAYPPEVILSHTFYRKNPEEFFRFYRAKMIYPKAEPNPAHVALAALERQGKLKSVITQNIDGLHQKAGSRTVWELHGSVLRNYCEECGKEYGVAFIMNSKSIPRCSCGGIVKPDVVLYEECLDQEVLNHAVADISGAEVLIVGGTSLSVYPAAGLIDYYKGSKLVLINRDATPRDQEADLVIRENIGKVLSHCVDVNI